MERGERKGIGQMLSRGRYVLLAAAAGAVLLLWPGEKQTAEQAALSLSERQSPSVTEMEAAMEEILCKISGVGRVDVMLTLDSGSELVLASDSTLRYSGNVHAPDDYSRSSDTVTLSGGGEKGVVVTQENYPLYRGALVVCDGGENDRVRLAVIEAVKALTGLGTDKIAVEKWQSGSAAE